MRTVRLYRKKIRMLDTDPIEYNHSLQSSKQILDIAAKEPLNALNDIKENAADFELSTNAMINGDKGVKLLECNSMQICLLATGDIADTSSPFDRNSVLTKREPKCIAEKYCAKNCLEQLHRTMDLIVDHEIQVYKDNREVANADPLSADQIRALVGPSN